MAAGIPEYIPFSTAPITVSREVATADAAPATPTATPAGPAADATPPPPAPAAKDAALADDEAFERMLARLKRELLAEQEQLGQAFQEP
jgi:hypothetical protein